MRKVLPGEGPRSRRPWTPWLVVGVGVIVSLLLFRHVLLRERALFEIEFGYRARERALAIEHALRDNLVHVESIGALFDASVKVERDEFRVFAESLLDDDPPLQAIGFDPVVPGDRRREHERALRLEGFRDYTINELDSEGRLVPAGERDEYVVVSFIEPLEGNEAALGYDLFSESNRRATLIRARDSGQPAMTGPLRLVQEPGGQSGVLICIPCYAKGAPQTVAERREQIRGYAIGVLRVGDLVEQALADLRPTGVNVWVRDVDAPGKGGLAHFHPSRTLRGGDGGGPEGSDGIERTFEFMVAGRRWRVDATPTAEYALGYTSWTPAAVGVAGLLVTCLLAGYLLWQNRVNERLGRAVAERERAEERQAGFGRLLDESHDEIYLFHAETLRFLHVNRGALNNLGYTMDELGGMTPLDLKPEISPEAFARLLRPLRLGQRNRVDFLTVHRRKDGSRYDVEVHLQLGTFDGSQVFVAVILDVTERKAFEERLSQSQRIAALGTLAGGIAHDFNNLLTSIVGYTDLALAELPPDHATRRKLGEVLKASERAREVVHQVLAFARPERGEPRTFDLREPVREALRLVRVSLPPDIEVHQQLGDHCAIEGDPSQVHQVLMNLLTNAAHAMRDRGGTLDVRICPIDLTPPEAAAAHLEPGPYARISVQDSGDGIPPEILDQIFDPFFTTKGPGEGTGMGLSVAHGIVHSHRGSLNATSEPGRGSRFDVLLPRSGATVARSTALAPAASGGNEKILVVDDEPAIASLLQEMLESQGYRVVAMRDSLAALETFRNGSSSFDLVITDFVMPGLTGGQLARELARIAPRTPVILVSGHGELLEREGIAGTGVRVSMTKPITGRELAATVRRVLDEA